MPTSAEWAAPLEIPAQWREAADHVIAHSCRRTLVVGRSDRGKSSFCRYLLGRLARASGTVCFVDADIAQKDVGPPATVSLAQFGPDDGGAPDFRAGQMLGLYFVGAVTPQGHFLDLVVGTRRLVERAASLPVVIDTTGLVTGPGYALKRAQIESLVPDAIVMVEQGHELGRLAAEYRYLQPLRISPATAVRRRSTAERRQGRAQAFCRYFSSAQAVRTPWKRVIIQRGRLREGLLCALADASGEVCGLAVVEHLDRAGITLRTPVSISDPAVVQAGELLLGPDGSHRPLHGSRAREDG